MPGKFAQDLNAANKIEHFVYETVFLDYLGYNPDVCKFVEDTQMQKSGADVIVNRNTPLEAIYDIKAASSSAGVHLKWGKPLGTFAQEISYLGQGGDLSEGWFVDDSKSTDIYIYVWIPEVTEQCRQTSGYAQVRDIDDIELMEVAFVKRDELRNRVATDISKTVPAVAPSWDSASEWLKEQAVCLRGMPHYKEPDLCAGYRLFYSKYNYPEQPINLLVPKSVIWETSIKDKKLLIHREASSEDCSWNIIPWDFMP